ncbi:MAG: hypothetical protein P0Y65_05875 [Candidatus Devosia phytovorans]|uniref:Uncharacterized protein n=1 Tax=Candidatus Devosia phytovorans TaxID=3121372 RepID=A0AAJ6B1W5_9HYPH|nr:hypothetical protein [Devosia sp.]WEK05784.1 MAG: hypothetical protein P0Y65_05875 [Devosia sp.]
MPIRGFDTEGVVACFDEMPGGGAVFDIDAPRNAPVKNPAQHLDKIVFHSDFDQYEIAAGPVDVSINHAALPTKTTVIGVSSGGGGWGPVFTPAVSVEIISDFRQTNTLLFAHDLGYVPKFMIALAGRRVPDGYVVQNAAGSYRRRVAFWANSTGIFVRDSASAAAVACPAITLDYRVLVFRNSEADPAKPLFSGGPGEPLILARGVIDSSKKYLRRTGVGDTPFAQNLGRTLDCNNGSMASASGGVVITEAGYGGSLPAPPFISVGVD